MNTAWVCLVGSGRVHGLPWWLRAGQRCRWEVRGRCRACRQSSPVRPPPVCPLDGWRQMLRVSCGGHPASGALQPLPGPSAVCEAAGRLAGCWRLLVPSLQAALGLLIQDHASPPDAPFLTHRALVPLPALRPQGAWVTQAHASLVLIS